MDKGKGAAKILSAGSKKEETGEKAGIHAPGSKEVPLSDMRLQKLEMPISRERTRKTWMGGCIGGNAISWLIYYRRRIN